MSAPDPTSSAESPPAAKAGKTVPLAVLLAVAAGLAVGGGAGAFAVGPALADGIAPAVAANARADHERAGKKKGAHDAEAGAEGASDDSAAADEEEGSEEEASGGDKAEGGHGGKEGAGASVYTLDNLVLNPAQSGGTRFLLLTISFELKSATSVDAMKARDAELRDAVLVTVGNRTVEQLADVAVRDSLKVELQAAAKKLFHKAVVRRVYFPQFVIQ